VPSKKARNDAPLWGAQAKPRPLGGDSAAVYLIAYARRIFEEMDSAAEEYLPFDDYSLYLSVEEGSIKGLGKVALCASALYAGIAQYGSFIQGVEILKRQGCAVAQAIVNAASKDLAVEQVLKKSTRADAGAASRLKRLFVKVRDREIEP
jgi:hypothetical protein